MRASDEELIARWGSMCEAKSGGFRWCAKSGLDIVAPMFIRINSSNAAVNEVRVQLIHGSIESIAHSSAVAFLEREQP